MNETVVGRIADAIAFAEGYYVVGSRPRRNNNPGDLTRDLTGKGIGWDGPYVVYGTPEDGQEALKCQVRLMFEGGHVYRPSMTIEEVAARYTSTQVSEWASNVAKRLGVGMGTRLEDLAALLPA